MPHRHRHVGDRGEGIEMATQLHVVIGRTGEYSDRDEWMVAAYADEALAQRHATLASDVARTFEGTDWDVRDAATNQYDPHMRIDYTGTSYYVCAVPMFDAVPEAN